MLKSKFNGERQPTFDIYATVCCCLLLIKVNTRKAFLSPHTHHVGRSVKSNYKQSRTRLTLHIKVKLLNLEAISQPQKPADSQTTASVKMYLAQGQGERALSPFPPFPLKAANLCAHILETLYL